MIIISIYSGRFDVSDTFADRDDDFIKNSCIYLGDNPIPLQIENHHDLAPYYPYLIATMGSDGDKSICRLSDRSFVDAEEEEHLTWKLKDFKRYYRKCKRLKMVYEIDSAIKDVCYFAPDTADREIAKRVFLYGEKATIDGLHDAVHEHYRKTLFDEMVRLGWDERTAGYWIWKDWRYLIKQEGNDTMDG